MSIWTELTCFLASVCLLSSIGVCLRCFPTSFADICLKGPLDVYLDQPNISFLASVCLIGLIGVCLNWFPPFLFCQCLSGGTC